MKNKWERERDRQSGKINKVVDIARTKIMMLEQIYI